MAEERKVSALLLVVVALVGMTAIAVGETSDPASSSAPPSSSFFSYSDFAHRKYFLGDWGGERTKLEERGIVFDFHYVNDLDANVKGGREKEAGWNRVRGTMDLDFARMFPNWTFLKGLTLHVTGLWQAGVNLGGGTSPYTGELYFGSIANPSGLVSKNTTRLDSFWLQESLFNGKLVIRAGQFAGMDFYGVSPVGKYYRIEPLDYAFGNLFTTYESYDPASGPAAEIKIAPIKHFYYRTAITSGNHNPYGDDPNGFHYVAKNKGVWLNEVGITVGETANPGKKQYPGLYKVGSSFNPDYFLNPVTQEMQHKNYLVYFMADQAVYRHQVGSDRGLDLHFAVDFAPQDYNRIDRQLMGGMIYHGPIPQRRNDSVAWGIVYSHVSDNFNTYYSSPAGREAGYVPLGTEKAFEVNYLAQVTPWLVVQPLGQIYQDIGANPRRGTGVIVGLSTKVTF
jgi:carbohydrate-selective porin OprB